MKKIILAITSTTLYALLYCYIGYISKRITTTKAFPQDTNTLSIQRNLLEKHKAKNILLQTNDDKKISATLVSRDNAKYAFILCHPYRKNKEFMTPFLELLSNDTLLFFDFRGHGESEKAPISLGIHEYKDVITVIDYMKKNFPELPLIGLGISMGGAALLKAAIEQPFFDALIIDSSFNNLSDTLTRLLSLRKFPETVPNFLIPYILSEFEHKVSGKIESMNLVSNLSNIKIPVLILHDQKDSICPFSCAQTLYNSLLGLKQLHIFNETRHAYAFYDKPEEYSQTLYNFINLINKQLINKTDAILVKE